MVRTSEEEEVMFCLTMEEWCGGAFKWCERSSDKHDVGACGNGICFSVLLVDNFSKIDHKLFCNFLPQF